MTSLTRRFYKNVDFLSDDNGFALILDGKTVKTPGGRLLVVPSLELVLCLVDEWREQGEKIQPFLMPVTQLVNTAIDRVQFDRETIIDHIMNYGNTDLLCYRASEPSDLAGRQDYLWQPLLDWVEIICGGSFLVTRGVMPLVQTDSLLFRLRAMISDLDLWQLTALQFSVPALGSIVLSMAFVLGRLSAEEALAASLLDETFQAEAWGYDYETVLRHDNLRRSMLAAAKLLKN